MGFWLAKVMRCRLHRELRFKFGSVGCSGDWSNGAVECHLYSFFTRRARAGTCLLRVQCLMVLRPFSFSPWPPSADPSCTWACQFFPMHTSDGAFSQQVSLSIKGFCLQKAALSTSNPFPASFASVAKHLSPTPSVWTFQTTTSRAQQPFCSVLLCLGSCFFLCH